MAHPDVESLSRYADPLGELGKTHPPALVLNPYHLSRIAVLLRLCRPADVAGLVVAIIVDPINRVLWRGTRANITKEGSKVQAPFFAHLDAPSAVAEVGSILGIKAALSRLHPNLELRCLHASACMAVFESSGGRRLFADAATTRRHAPRQEAGSRNGVVPAIATASPIAGTLRSARRFFNCGETTEPLARRELSFAHAA
jgi:hypothetical protein